MLPRKRKETSSSSGRPQQRPHPQHHHQPPLYSHHQPPLYSHHQPPLYSSYHQPLLYPASAGGHQYYQQQQQRQQQSFHPAHPHQPSLFVAPHHYSQHSSFFPRCPPPSFPTPNVFHQPPDPSPPVQEKALAPSEKYYKHHVSLGSFNERLLAKDAATLMFGSTLKLKHTDNSKDGHYQVYGCDNKQHCGLRVKLQQMGGEQGNWIVMVGKGENDGHPKDSHSLHQDCKSKGLFAHGLTHHVKEIIDKVFPSGFRKDIAERTLLDQVHKFLIDHKSIEYNSIASTPHLYESFKLQFKDYIKNTKTKNAPPPASSPFDIRELCRKHTLHIPQEYVPRSDFKSSKELAQALQIDVNACLLTHLGSGWPLELYTAHQEKENNERTKKESRAKLSAQRGELFGALVAFSPATIFKLLEGGRGPKGTRFRGHDGTHGCIGRHQLITHALHELRYRDTQFKPTLSAVPTHWLIAREEWKSAVSACDLIMQWLYKELFGVELELDFSVSDQAGGLREATHSVWGDGTMVLTCFFHVMQAVRDSLLSKFTDKTYKSGPGPSGKKKTSQGMKDVYLLHNSSTPAQFSACSELIVNQWTMDGQHEATKHLKDTYLAKRKEKWYYGASGTPGIFPIGNPIETYNRWGLKDPQMTMNCSLANFLERELPELLKREARRSLKMIPGEFVHQTHETSFALFVVNCMDETFDSKPYDDNSGRKLYLTNTAITAGVEITEERIAAYRAAREGDKTYFASANEGTSASIKRSPRQQARDSIFATSGFCCVSIDDNENLVGNCPKCIKKMGWDCPSVLNVRKITKGYRNNEDPKSLMFVYSEERAKQNGKHQSQFLSGKSVPKSKAKRTELLKDTTFWLKQKKTKYLYETCLGLMILPQRGEVGAIGISRFRDRTELIKQLSAIADDPKAFRKNQEHQRQTERELGAYGYSDFTSKLDNNIQTKSNQGDEESGFAADKKMTSAMPFITQEDDDDISLIGYHTN